MPVVFSFVGYHLGYGPLGDSHLLCKYLLRIFHPPPPRPSKPSPPLHTCIPVVVGIGTDGRRRDRGGEGISELGWLTAEGGYISLPSLLQSLPGRAREKCSTNTVH